MIRKVWLIGASTLMSAMSMAQALSASEQEVDQAFKNLRSTPNALLRMMGTEYFGSTQTPFASDLFYNRPAISNLQDLKMELVEARNSIQERRVVADGRHVWGVDLLKNTYSTARYGSYTATKPTDYEQNAFQSLNVYAAGQSAWQARMAREVWSGTDAIYRPWIPPSSNRSEYTVEGGATSPDAVVTTRNYVSTAAKKFHTYWVTKAGTPTRSLTFELDQDNVGNWNLTAVYFSDRATVGTVQRLIDWKLDVYTGTLPSTGIFSYIPPAGARAVAGPRPNGSG